MGGADTRLLTRLAVGRMMCQRVFGNPLTTRSWYERAFGNPLRLGAGLGEVRELTVGRTIRWRVLGNPRRLRAGLGEVRELAVGGNEMSESPRQPSDDQ